MRTNPIPPLSPLPPQAKQTTPGVPQRTLTPTHAATRIHFFGYRTPCASPTRCALTRRFIILSMLPSILLSMPALLDDVMCAYPHTAIGMQLRSKLTIADLTA